MLWKANGTLPPFDMGDDADAFGISIWVDGVGDVDSGGGPPDRSLVADDGLLDRAAKYLATISMTLDHC